MALYWQRADGTGATRFNEGWGAFSPDGRWLAYSSNETGRFEVDVQPFPKANGKWRIAVLQPFADPGEAKSESVVVFLNFFDELSRLAPPK